MQRRGCHPPPSSQLLIDLKWQKRIIVSNVLCNGVMFSGQFCLCLSVKSLRKYSLSPSLSFSLSLSLSPPLSLSLTYPDESVGHCDFVEVGIPPVQEIGIRPPDPKYLVCTGYLVKLKRSLISYSFLAILFFINEL